MQGTRDRWSVWTWRNAPPRPGGSEKIIVARDRIARRPGSNQTDSHGLRLRSVIEPKQAHGKAVQVFLAPVEPDLRDAPDAKVRPDRWAGRKAAKSWMFDDLPAWNHAPEGRLRRVVELGKPRVRT